MATKKELLEIAEKLCNVRTSCTNCPVILRNSRNCWLATHNLTKELPPIFKGVTLDEHE